MFGELLRFGAQGVVFAPLLSPVPLSFAERSRQASITVDMGKLSVRAIARQLMPPSRRRCASPRLNTRIGRPRRSTGPLCCPTADLAAVPDLGVTICVFGPSTR
jgi:hypothetical protein